MWNFGPFRLDPDNAMLWRGERPIALTLKAFSVLHYLVEHAGILVTKDALLDAVWPETAVSDTALRVVINELRKALDDPAHSPQFIATVHRRGYRFLTPVIRVDLPEDGVGVFPVMAHITPSTALSPLSVNGGPITLETETPTPLEAIDYPAHADQVAVGGRNRALGSLTMVQSPCSAVSPRDYSLEDRFCDACETPLPTLSSPDEPEVALPMTGDPGYPQRLVSPSAPIDTRAMLQPLTSWVSTGEFKLVTVLCGVLTYSAPSGSLDLEDRYRLMQTAYTLVLSEIQRYEGTLQHVTANGFLAIFGAPVAQEDHAQRAVLAALGLQRRLRALPADVGLPLAEIALRVGLHTGPEVVGQLGNNALMLSTAGDTTELATQLTRGTAAGTTVVSRATARYVRRVVRVVASELDRVIGVPLPYAAYQVLGMRLQRRSGAYFRGRTLTPFVGRARELATLHELLERVKEGRGQIVGIVGEPGIGKSRLLVEFRRSLRKSQVIYLAGGCVSYGSTTPYLPVLDILRNTCGIVQTDAPEAIRAKVLQCLQAIGISPDIWTPYLLHLLGVSKDTVELTTLTAQTIKWRTFEALHQMCLHGSQQRPLIVEIENLHWLDPSSEEYLTALADRLSGAAILLLATYRPGYRQPWLGKSYATQITLPSLTSQDSYRVVQTLLQHASAMDTLAPVILARAQGNPFFLEELSRAAIEQGRQPQWWKIPDTIQAVLAARFDRLPPATKHVLQTAAVIGPDVSLSLLQTLMEMPEAMLHHCLDQLQAAELLYAIHGLPEITYAFTHTLTQEVAYQTILRRTRQQTHARIIGIIERLYADRLESQVARLAHHARQGEVWHKAVLYLRQAGAQAITRSAYREAVTCFEQALAALEHLPACRDTCEQAIDLRFELRKAMTPLSRDEWRLLGHLREAQTRAEILNDPYRLGWACAYMAQGYISMDIPDRAIEYGQRALTIADALADVGLQVTASLYLGQFLFTLGNYRPAIDSLRKTVESVAAERLQERFGMAGLPAVFSRTWLAWCLAEVGEFAEGVNYAEEAIRIAEAAEQPNDLSAAYAGMGRLYLCKGDFHQAFPVLEQGLHLCQSWDIRSWLPTIAVLLSTAYALAGRMAKAVPLLEQAVAQGTNGIRITWLSEAYLLTGLLEEGTTLAWRALAFARTHKGLGSQAYALRLLGELAAHRDPPEVEQAEDHYHQALALADELGMRPLLAHCYLGLGTLYAKIHWRERACIALSTASNLFRSLEMPFWLSRSEATLVEVSRSF